nr:ABC transporter family substrate-binding protein [Antrihabitans sp. YC2-6]
MLLPACSSNSDVSVGCDVLGGANDINPKDPSEVQDGGNLRLSLGSLPANYNALHIDGNEAEAAGMLRWMMPRAFTTNSAGEPSVNKDYFTNVELTGENPQQVTYTIRPEAVWSDGTPITWEDIRSEADALNTQNPDFRIAISNGFDRVEKVERGVDDKQAVLTFKSNYAEWKGQFAGNSFLFPKSATENPEAFNNSLLEGLPITAGPFLIQSIDKGQNRITLARNPLWWGDKPKLDTVTYLVLDDSARVQALQNNEIDAVGLGTIDELQTASESPGVVIRCAPGYQFSHVTFNGAEGAILSDPALRLAIGKGIDRQEVADAIQNGVVDNPEPLNNHVYLKGQDGYQDNSAVVAYDPDKARQELDDLGWKLNGNVREKDGRKLDVRLITSQTNTGEDIAKIIQGDLGEIGVNVIIEAKPSQGYFDDVIIPGNFDLGLWSWVGDPFPLSGLPQIYYLNPDDKQGNYGRVGSPEINALIEQDIAELDPQKAIEIANEIDKKVFAIGHSLPLMQSPGNVGVRDSLANYGATGLASYDYTKIGFLK